MVKITEWSFRSEQQGAASRLEKGALGELDFKQILGQAQEDQSQTPPERSEPAEQRAPERKEESEVEALEKVERDAETKSGENAGRDSSGAPSEEVAPEEYVEPLILSYMAEIVQEVQPEETASDEVGEETGLEEGGFARWMRAAQEGEAVASRHQDAETEIPDDFAEQLGVAQGSPAQNSQNVFDLLSASEMMDPDLVVDQTPDQILNRIQQVATSANVPVFEEVADAVMPQVVRGIATLMRDGLAEMRLQLDPPELGEIELRVRTMDGVVRGQMMVQHPEIKQLLEAQLSRLRAALEQQGLELEGLDVGVAHDQHFGQSGESERDQGSALPGLWSNRPSNESRPEEEGPVRRYISDRGVDYLV